MSFTQCLMLTMLVVSSLCSLAAADKGVDREAWRTYIGQPGPSGWRAHVIHPDPKDAGPDGFNAHDWDADGDLDVLVNYEEGEYSRLYFNPGNKAIHQVWEEYIQFDHRKCEDSSMGDLDNDGDIDYIANGNIVFWNPGPRHVRDVSKWQQTNIAKGGRAPLVADLDGDGRNDLIIDGLRWSRQPASGADNGKNWKGFDIGDPPGKRAWTMSAFAIDMDVDGDLDVLVQDRMFGTYYFVNPGRKDIEKKWDRIIIDEQPKSMFMTVGDINQDGRIDLIRVKPDIDIFLRTNDRGEPAYHKVTVPVLPGPGGKKKVPGAKGVTILEVDGDSRRKEIVVIPEYSAQSWYLRFKGDGTQPEHWTTTHFGMPGAVTRKKNDNAYLADLDGDGDLDIATTEENGGWGVVWFENPLRKP